MKLLKAINTSINEIILQEMMKKYKASESDFIDTSEAYSQLMFIGNNKVVVPYINIGLMPDNPISGNQCVVDFAYYLLDNVQGLVFGASQIGFSLILAEEKGEQILEHVSFGGGYGISNGAEVAVKCSDLYFFLPDDSGLSSPHKPFVPRNTPTFKSNLDPDKVDLFFKLENLPAELRQMLGDDVHVLTWKSIFI